MDNLKELCKQIEYSFRQYKGLLDEYNELCRLFNEITTLSNYSVARVLDETIKGIAYTSAEPNFEVRKRYLSEAIKDFLSGMDEVDVVLKYDDILYRYNGGRL